MKKTLSLLIASTALTAAIGVPAWSAMQSTADGGLRPCATLIEGRPQAMPLVLASDDDDDRHRWRDGMQRGHDDDDHDDDDDDRRRGIPATAGTVAPPQNGLFGTRTPPQVQVN